MARSWIKAEFERISQRCGGCLEVYFQGDFVEGQKRISNSTEIISVSVIAIQKGNVAPSRFVFMSGDIDNRVSDPMNFTSNSPGANNKASGLAGLLETARVLSQFKFNGSIIYAALSGEEQRLWGDRIMAKQDGWRIKPVLKG